jgi:hypothetical protein
MIRKQNKTGRLSLRYLAAVFLLLSTFAISLLPNESVSAATGVIDPNGDGSNNSWGATGSATRFGAIDDGISQPSTPTISDYIAGSANNGGNVFLRMGTLASVISVSQVQVWAYHNDGSNCQLGVGLFDDDDSTVRASAQNMPQRTGNTWDSITFSGLSLTQAQLDTLSVRLSAAKNGGGSPANCTVYAMYADVTYSESILSADVVDSGGNPVMSPSVGLSSLNSDFACQTSTATLGTSSQKIRVYNTTANGNWTLSIAPTDGSSALWSNGMDSYDFNDPSGTPAGCSGGQLTVDAADNGTITPEGSCSSAGISKGASTAFSGGTSDITLLNASGSQTGCYFDLINVNLSQKIPGEVPASVSPYTINMTLTVTAN